MQSPKVYIGIDPGSNTGVAVWYPQQKQLEVLQFKSHCEAMLFLYDKFRDFDKSLVKFRIEDARMAPPRPDLADINKGKEQGVGYVKAYSKDWEAFCRCCDFDYEMVKASHTKTTPEYFKMLTGIKTLKTEDHKRDAGMLVYGR